MENDPKQICDQISVFEPSRTTIRTSWNHHQNLLEHCRYKQRNKSKIFMRSSWGRGTWMMATGLSSILKKPLGSTCSTHYEVCAALNSVLVNFMAGLRPFKPPCRGTWWPTAINGTLTPHSAVLVLGLLVFSYGSLGSVALHTDVFATRHLWRARVFDPWGRGQPSWPLGLRRHGAVLFSLHPLGWISALITCRGLWQPVESESTASSGSTAPPTGTHGWPIGSSYASLGVFPKPTKRDQVNVLFRWSKKPQTFIFFVLFIKYFKCVL